jgi:hypothetical protein
VTVSAARVAAHLCHANGCTVKTKPEMLMCFRHWKMVPVRLQRAVWRTYRPGQCEDMSPSADWHLAADAAIGAVSVLERRPYSESQRKALIAAGYNAAGLAAGTLLNL